ncbi:uncharacterized protein LOC144103846 isoform X2 [Amblyomma americanum]
MQAVQANAIVNNDNELLKMADGGGEKQLTYTQDNVSVRFASPRGEQTVSGKLEITKERHGHVVSWAPYEPPAEVKAQEQRYDEHSAGIWEDLTADSTVSYHVGGRDKTQSSGVVKIKKDDNGAVASSGDAPSPSSSAAQSISFEVTELNSYRLRQVCDTHELTLNLSDGTRLPVFVFIERRHEHFIRALHEHVSFKRSDPADAYSLVYVSPLRDVSQATEQVTDKAPSPTPSPAPSPVIGQAASQAKDKAASCSSTPGGTVVGVPTTVARPTPLMPGPQAIQFLVSRAPNVMVQSQPNGQTRLVPQQSLRLVLSQSGSHPLADGVKPQPSIVPHPVQLLVQPPQPHLPLPPPPAVSPAQAIPPPQPSPFHSGLVISDVRSQAPGHCGSPSESQASVAPPVRRRGPHWPTEEKLELLALLRKRRALVNPRLADGISKKEKLEGWKQVTTILNRHHPTTGGRCIAEVKKQWQNLFLKAKRERRELMGDGGGTKSGAEGTTPAQLSGLSLKVFETFGENYYVHEDDMPMDVDANDSILGPSSCLEPDAPFLSESHHPEVILLPRSPDSSEQSRQPMVGDPSAHKLFNATSSTERSNAVPGQLLCNQNLNIGQTSNCPTGAPGALPMWGFKKEEPERVPCVKQESWPEATDASDGSEDEDAVTRGIHGGGMRNDCAPEGAQVVNGTTFVGSLAKMCEAVQRAANEIVLLKRREHKMKMSALRAKMDYYETKRRLLQAEGGANSLM